MSGFKMPEMTCTDEDHKRFMKMTADLMKQQDKYIHEIDKMEETLKNTDASTQHPTQPNRLHSHRDSPHGLIQLAIRAAYRRRFRIANRGHR